MSYETFQKQVQSRLKPEQIHDPAKAPLPPYFPDTPIARRTYARYHDCISSFDDFVRKVLSDLEADGLAGETIVMVYSDNGAGILRGKSTAFETGLRVPLLVRFPAKFRHLGPC